MLAPANTNANKTNTIVFRIFGITFHVEVKNTIADNTISIAPVINIAVFLLEDLSYLVLVSSEILMSSFSYVLALNSAVLFS